MRNQGLIRDSNAADQIIIYAIVGLISISMLSIGAYFAMSNSDDAAASSDVEMETWIDPTIEI